MLSKQKIKLNDYVYTLGVSLIIKILKVSSNALDTKNFLANQKLNIEKLLAWTPGYISET